MEKVVNLNLLTIPNVIAIGAILFFWGCCAYALWSHIGSQPILPAANSNSG